MNNKLIPPLQYLPLELMKRHRIVPFEFDAERRALRIASNSPDDTALVKELSRRAGDVKIELYQANPEAIENVIKRFSTLSGANVANENNAKADSGVLAHPADSPIADLIREPEHLSNQDGPGRKSRGSVLFVTSNHKLSEPMLAAFRAERYILKIAVSLDFAMEYLDSETFDYIFVEERLQGRASALLQKICQVSPATALRFYSSEASLLVNDTQEEMTVNLFRKNLSLSRFLAAKSDKPINSHESLVARLAENLSVKYDLPGHIRAAVTTAAYLHNLAEDDLNQKGRYSQSDIIALSAARLSSWQYPPLVVNILRSAYQNPSGMPRNISELEFLAASILTAVDIYCHNFPAPAALSPEQMTQIKDTLNREKDKIALADVINQLLGVIADEMASCPSRELPSNLHIFICRGALPKSFDEFISRQGFTVSYSRTVAECTAACGRSRPHLMLIRDSGQVDEIYDLLLQLALQGIPIDQIPTFLMVDAPVTGEAMAFLKNGIEDVLAVNLDAEIIATKLKRLKNRWEEKAQYRRSVLQELGTHGSLEDMGLVDLLEASRGSGRPVQISISGEGQHATLYLEKGKILYAECGSESGIEAMIKCIGWRKGVWSIDPIDASKLPPPNLNRGIDSILLEACVNIDTIGR